MSILQMLTASRNRCVFLHSFRKHLRKVFCVVFLQLHTRCENACADKITNDNATAHNTTRCGKVHTSTMSIFAVQHGGENAATPHNASWTVAAHTKLNLPRTTKTSETLSYNKHYRKNVEFVKPSTFQILTCRMSTFQILTVSKNTSFQQFRLFVSFRLKNILKKIIFLVSVLKSFVFWAKLSVQLSTTQTIETLKLLPMGISPPPTWILW